MEDTIDKLHKSLLVLLKEFHRVCYENHLTYVVTGGTCLGAIRHKGFIPWDDDVDVCMPRDEYKRFIDVCNNGALMPGVALQQYGKKEPHYSCPFVRLRLDNTLCVIPYHKQSGWNHLGIFLDIFPYDKLAFSNERMIMAIKNKYLAVQRAIDNKLACKCSSFKSKIFHVLLAPIPVTHLIKKRQAVVRRLEKRRSGNESYYIDLNTPYTLKRSIFSSSIFSNREIVNFEDTSVFVPKDFDAFLTTMYGDYMKIPPVEKQVAHLPEIIRFKN